MPTSLAGQRWVITGASMGIGAALAREVAARGGLPVLAARSAEALDALAAELRERHGIAALVAPTDVTDPAQCERLAALARERLGGIDVLVLNAGVSMHGRFEDASPEVFRRLMDINYFGAIDCIRAALPELKKSRGSIVAVSSVAGLRGYPMRSGYSASKFALHGLCESLRVELMDDGVHVLVVSPGFIATDIRRRALGPTAEEGSGGHDVTVGAAMSAEDCARAIVDATLARRRHVVLTPTAKLATALSRWLPATSDRLLARRLRQGRI